jgi:mono/diheme cytochrome c family protein
VRIVAGLVLLVLVGCSRLEKTAEERGAGVFLRTCSGCHGADGRGSSRPGFKVPPRDLTDPSLKDLRDAEIEAVIREGKGQMPPFGRLMRPEDLDAVVRFVRSLHGGGAGNTAGTTEAQSASTTSAP